jgi:hypothetical protein
MAKSGRPERKRRATAPDTRTVSRKPLHCYLLSANLAARPRAAKTTAKLAKFAKMCAV